MGAAANDGTAGGSRRDLSSPDLAPADSTSSSGRDRAGGNGAVRVPRDGRPVEVGISIQSDASSVGKATGFASFNYGDQKALFTAVITWINKNGGWLGHPLVPVFYDASSYGDVNEQANEACALWTQDHHVVMAHLLSRLSIPSMYQCLHKNNAIIFQTFGAAGLRADFARYMPQALFTEYASWDRFAPFWVGRLAKMGYFTPWDNQQGRASRTAPVKVGIIYQANSLVDRGWAHLKQVIEARGIAVSDVVSWNSIQDISGFVLRFKAEGVTHVFFDQLTGFAYPQQAESQGYRARYAVSSPNFIKDFLVLGATPKAQLQGMLGVGWSPYLDVDTAQDPGTNAAQNKCLDIMREEGQDVSKRNYKLIAFVACDAFLHGQVAVSRAGGVDTLSLISGLRATAATFQRASAFGSADYGPTDPGLLSTARDIAYDAACTCTRYVGGNQRIP